MIWVNFFHAYQPPGWSPAVLDTVIAESYRPFFAWLDRHPNVHVTLNLSASLTEQLHARGADDVLRSIAQLAGRNQLELTGSAIYHPILPLLPESIVRRQIEENTKRNRELLGHIYAPRGFFPPEMAYASHLARSITGAGFSWILLDELSCRGTIGDIDFSPWYQDASAPLILLFRNRVISDFLFFTADLTNPNDFWKHVEQDGRSHDELITAMDLENLGHHRPGLDRYWQELVEDPRATPLTVSEYLAQRPVHEPTRITPVTASWSTRPVDLSAGVPFPLWQHPDNPLHRLQWQLTNLVIEEIGSAVTYCAPNVQSKFDRVFASDQYWWASATPWWDVSIIQRGADALVAILRELGGSEPACARAQSLRDSLVELARSWHDQGVAEQRRRDFFRHGETRRLGGTLLTK